MNGSLAAVLAMVDHMVIRPLASRTATCLRTLAMDLSSDVLSLGLPVESVDGMVSSMGTLEAAEVLAVAVWRVVARLIRGARRAHNLSRGGDGRSMDCLATRASSQEVSTIK